MKILICGWGRSGKDTLAEFWNQQFGVKFTSSSWFCCEKVVFPMLLVKYGYVFVKDCFEDRHNHRAEWMQIISDYNKDDLSRLTKEILVENDLYVGMRSKEELAASRHLFDWVDAEGRIAKESEESCTVTKEMANIVLENKVSMELFKANAYNLGRVLFKNN